MKKLLAPLFFFIWVSASESQTPAPIQFRELTQAQRVVLHSPEVIMLEFAPLTRRVSADVYEKMSGPFKPTDPIRFNLMGTNTSLITLPVRRLDPYSQNKLRLFRDNQELEYRKDKAELIRTKHTTEWRGIRVRLVELNPNEPKVLETFDLADWYEPLGPGHYVLSTQHRFVQGGKWVESAAITFEVQDTKPQ
ncbi:MAG: hypothetical protein AABN95_22840 [Acidobacteriota bacterium]